jgi:deoxycytidylate deaminase
MVKRIRTNQPDRSPVEITNPELIFGIVGPIGVDLSSVIDALSAALKEVRYKPLQIHLTNYIEHERVKTKIDDASYSKRYLSLIKKANEYRRLAKNAGALAGLAILNIRRLRQGASKSPKLPSKGTAYIIRQFKRPEEIELMRRVYGRKFVQVSIFGSELDRRAILINKIRAYDPSPKTDPDCEKQAINLIDVDNNQADDDFGQRVADVFHRGDVFVDGIDAKKAAETIERFICALFGDNRISPHKDEYGLYAAAGAALRSLDLARQVGAAIFSKDAEVISLGCNEVPKAGGGTYWSDSPPTFRDIDLKKDANQERRDEIFYDLVERMSGENFLSEQPKEPADIQAYAEKMMTKRSIKDSQLMDIIEFGRMIHAEMSAISDASRLGRPTKGGTLYSTAFPCHLCAKHIVAAGIDRVVFLEPYPKSWAKKLHDDSITFNPKEKSKVLFQPFMGISPRRYRDIFEKKARKNNGKIQDWYEGKPVPRIEDRSSAYIDNEGPWAISALGELYIPPRSKRR